MNLSGGGSWKCNSGMWIEQNRSDREIGIIYMCPWRIRDSSRRDNCSDRPN